MTPHPGVAALVITFNPPRELVDRLSELAPCFNALLVVDNGSAPEQQLLLDRLEAIPNLRLIRNHGNVGQAAGLNQGLLALEAMGFVWAMTLDQDSGATPGFVENMRRALERYEATDRLALLAPCYFDPEEMSFRKIAGQLLPGNYVKVAMVPTSGNLLNIAVAREIGMFRADYFIDWVDHEYCLRCTVHGFDVITTLDAVLVHTIGNPEARRFLFYRRLVRYQSPVRRYYLIRNFTRTYLDYRRRMPSWGRRERKRVLNQVKQVLLLGPDRWTTLRMMLRGLADGLRGRMGPCPHRLEARR